MMTPTHMMLAAALFSRPGAAARNTAALVGGLIPDLGIYVLWIWSKLAGIPEWQVWREIYWQPPWKTSVNLGHSVVVYVVALALLFVFVARLDRHRLMAGTLGVVTIFLLAGFSAAATDFPVHNDDAHPPFWPISLWTFESPVSYWDPAHFGREFGLFEIGLGIALAVVLWLRHSNIWARVAIGLAGVSYLAVPAYFKATLGG
ncbi:MAG: hypothetical protein AAGD23_10650 [Pseudomonadota bacterium]